MKVVEILNQLIQIKDHLLDTFGPFEHVSLVQPLRAFTTNGGYKKTGAANPRASATWIR